MDNLVESDLYQTRNIPTLFIPLDSDYDYSFRPNCRLSLPGSKSECLGAQTVHEQTLFNRDERLVVGRCTSRRSEDQLCFQ